MAGEAGKGAIPRQVDKKKYDECPLWENIEKKKIGKQFDKAIEGVKKLRRDR